MDQNQQQQNANSPFSPPRSPTKRVPAAQDDLGTVEFVVSAPPLFKSVAVVCAKSSAATSSIVVGDIVPVQLDVTLFSSTIDTAHDFSAEVVVRDDDWIVTGPKVVNVALRSGEPHTLTANLLAMRDGWLPLPSLALVPASLSSSSSVEQQQQPQPIVTSLTSAAVRILVLPKPKSTVFVPYPTK